ncbi:enoyl-CoA hydratase-related protein [Saccharomonospora sp. NPDC046836]|uniref:enoyl-CoA hydratase/isomerase family protein n=1 Tax=Saccharomonospora sp. NPDC046836 TaxID=3156921 RepID=UPI0033C3667F
MSVDLTVTGHVAEVVVNRPEAMNAIDHEHRKALRDIWAEVDERDEVRVVILTGAGERAFSTGSDLKRTMPPEESYAELTFGRVESAHLLAGMQTDKPLLAAVNGYAMGGGLELALACDLRIASVNAQFGMSEVRVGSIPGGGGTQRLPRLVGRALAMQMLLTGDRIDAQQALHSGLVSEVVEPERLLPRAHEIAERIAWNAPLAVRAVKRLVERGADLPLEQAIETENYVWGLLRDTADRIEGRQAFAEKRTPRYTGR